MSLHGSTRENQIELHLLEGCSISRDEPILLLFFFPVASSFKIQLPPIPKIFRAHENHICSLKSLYLEINCSHQQN